MINNPHGGSGQAEPDHFPEQQHANDIRPQDTEVRETDQNQTAEKEVSKKSSVQESLQEQPVKDKNPAKANSRANSINSKPLLSSTDE